MKAFTNAMKFAVVGLLILSLVLVLTGCQNNTDEKPSQGTEEANQVSDTAFSSDYDALRYAKLGDIITSNTYLVAVTNGMKTYYVHGRYVLVSSATNTVVQLRDEIEVPNTSLSIREIISADKDFDMEKASVSFFTADGTQISGTLDETLSSTITDCVVEYAEWEDVNETFGVVQSYLFTYGYVPVKITGYYEKDSDDSADTDGSDDEDDDTSSDDGDTEDDTDETSSETDDDPAEDDSDSDQSADSEGDTSTDEA